MATAPTTAPAPDELPVRRDGGREYCDPRDVVCALGYLPYDQISDAAIWAAPVIDVSDERTTFEDDEHDAQRIRSFVALIQAKQMRPTWSLVLHETEEGLLPLEDGNHRLRAYHLCGEEVPVALYQLP